MFRARQIERQQSKSMARDVLGRPPNTLAGWGDEGRLGMSGGESGPYGTAYGRDKNGMPGAAGKAGLVVKGNSERGRLGDGEEVAEVGS